MLSCSWGEAFLLDTLRHRDPGLRCLVALDVSAAAFNNSLIRALGGVQTDDYSVAKINMTNLASLALPLAAVGDLLVSRESSSLHAGESLCREDLALNGFTNLL
eukprot:6176713-Pleurochrysis_carterae.AAC.1